MKIASCFRWVGLASALALWPVAQAAEIVPAPVPDNPAPVQKSLTGVIKEKAPSQLTLSRADGQGDVKVTLTDGVLVTKGDRPASVADLVPGTRVEVTLKADTFEAVSIRILDAGSKP